MSRGEKSSAPKDAIARPRLGRYRARTAWMFLLPTLAVMGVIAIYPLASTIYDSFTDARMGEVGGRHFIGFENFAFLMQDVDFRRAFGLTTVFTITTVAAELAIGLAVALSLHASFRGRSMVRAAVLIPWALPTVISAQMWKWMFNDVYGVWNDLLVRRLHLWKENVAFLADASTSLYAVMAVDIWKTTPFVALILLAGLQVIPRELTEAAQIDGASRTQILARITLPLLRPALFTCLVFRTLDALRIFDLFYVMFGNRPDMQTLATYAHQNLIAMSDIGYGSAVSVAVFLVIGVFIALYMAFFRSREA